MTRNPSVIILLAVLFVLGGLTSSLALDLDSVLQNHDPRFDEGISQLSESPPAQNTAKPASSTLTLQEINDLI